jgi:3-oxoacyl-(acyl-carrier-protein) synthase
MMTITNEDIPAVSTIGDLRACVIRKLAGKARRRVNPVVTGVGFITPIGNDRVTVEQSLREGRHGIARVEFLGNPELSDQGGRHRQGLPVDSPKWRDWSWPHGYDIPKEVLRGLAPHGLYAICAVEQALSHAGLHPADVAEDPDTGLYCASAGSAMLLHHNLAQMRAVRGARGNPHRRRQLDRRDAQLQPRRPFPDHRHGLRLRLGLRLVEPRARLRDRRPAGSGASGARSSSAPRR